MAIAHSLSLGEFSPKKKAKFMTMPKFKLDFDFNTDTGSELLDGRVKKVAEAIGPKILAKHIKERMDQIEKAMAGVDSDIAKKQKAFFKSSGISPKAKTITPAQKTLMDKFVNEIEDLVKRLQGYLEKIVDGINRLDSQKWIAEVYEASYEKLKKIIGNASFSRASGGRAKIIIMAAVAVAVAAVVIVATVVSGGLLAGVIIAVIGVSLGIIATTGKTVIALIKTRDKLRSSVAKLSAESKIVDELTKQCDAAVKSFREKDKAWLKKTGISSKDFEKTFGKGKPDSEKLFPILAGHKRTFVQFFKHLKDIEMLADKIAMGILGLKKSKRELEIKLHYASKSVSDAISNGDSMDQKTIAAIRQTLDNMPPQLAEIERNIGVAEKDLKNLIELVKSSREISQAFKSHKVVVSKIKGSMIKMSQVETGFDTLDKIGGSLKSLGGDAIKINKAANA